MQQREEKQLESALETIIQRVNDLKSSIASMIFKIENEYETLNWPTFLDNYALLSGHVLKINPHNDLHTKLTNFSLHHCRKS